MIDLLKDLNDEQRKAVTETEGNIIIFAGAGSGKTRVLTRRAAYLIHCGIANPKNILAITFTNKAANEMKERITSLVGKTANDMWISTFHSMCARILRAHASELGYDPKFTIYDSDDSLTLIKKIIKNYKYLVSPKTVLNAISNAKNNGLNAEDYLEDSGHDYTIYKIYKEYEELLFMYNAFDFDDLLLKTKELFELCPDVLAFYQDQFKYIMVDEYQDTNHIQLELITKLSEEYGNLCVVGDDDQSIYKFRGADIHNILNFKKEFHKTKAVYLVENYRSTKNILGAASSIISHNEERAEKDLFTSNEAGKPVNVVKCYNDKSEAEYVISNIKAVNSSIDYSDIAILYRSNRQSRQLEEACIKYGVPYRIVNGLSFYQRKEIKDLLAYLKIIVNPSDDIAIERIINVPTRSIGQTTIKKIEDFASTNKISFMKALKRIDEIPGISKKTNVVIHAFTDSIDFFREGIEEGGSINFYIDSILNVMGYNDYLTNNYSDEDLKQRQGNIEEFQNKISEIETEEDFSLNKFLEDIALLSEKNAEDADCITMMTAHASKGLEFKKVYIVGLNEGLFPASKDTEEERRLMYVAVTRAMKELTLTYTSTRFKNGHFEYSPVSCFLRELPDKYCTYTSF